MVVDDDFVRVGSSNLNNRSMLLDTDCDLAVEARGERRIAEAIAGFRHRLLGEHLPASVEEVARQPQEQGSLLAAIECLRTDARTLTPLEWPPLTREVMAAPDVIAPEYPLDPSVVVRRMLPEEERHPVRNGCSCGLRSSCWCWVSPPHGDGRRSPNGSIPKAWPNRFRPCAAAR